MIWTATIAALLMGGSAVLLLYGILMALNAIEKHLYYIEHHLYYIRFRGLMGPNGEEPQ